MMKEAVWVPAVAGDSIVPGSDMASPGARLIFFREVVVVKVALTPCSRMVMPDTGADPLFLILRVKATGTLGNDDDAALSVVVKILSGSVAR